MNQADNLAQVDVLAVLEQTSAGLWSVANNCTRSDLSTAMRARAEEFDRSRAAVADLVAAAEMVLEFPNTGPAHDTLRAALRPFNGNPQA